MAAIIPTEERVRLRIADLQRSLQESAKFVAGETLSSP